MSLLCNGLEGMIIAEITFPETNKPTFFGLCYSLRYGQMVKVDSTMQAAQVQFPLLERKKITVGPCYQTEYMFEWVCKPRFLVLLHPMSK